MTYTMTVCEGENNERSVLNPSPAIIDRAIDDLIPAMYHFVILEAEPSIENCAYIQTLIERDGKSKGLYLVEARYKFSIGFNHYKKYIGDPNEVKNLFRGFADGAPPNVAGWDDITDNLAADGR